MALKLMYITNKKEVAIIAEKNGIDWVFVDLEIKGKEKRQGHLDTVISHHSIEDVKKIKSVLSKSDLLVRVNPIYEDSKDEINKVIDNGADIIMLPFFKTASEVKSFISYVNGRAKVCLLCETAEAVENIDNILLLDGIDYVHIGLNDLHLSYNMKFMFELLADGTVDMLCSKFKAKGISYGFGGIACIGQGVLPAEHIIAEHYRLGSSMAILSRSFCNTDVINKLDQIEKSFSLGISNIRKYESKLVNETEDFYYLNTLEVRKKINQIVELI
jgi:hypothetical protein